MNAIPKVLVLCTANRCRSPFAAAALDRALSERDLDAVVTSAGLLAPGWPVPERGLKVLGELGYDLGAHRSIQVDGAMLEGADLIITMAREHVREAVALAPDTWYRSFTLKELAGHRREQPRPDDNLATWTRRLAAGRDVTAILGPCAADDVADPIGRLTRPWRRMAAEVSHAVCDVADLLEPLMPRRARR